MEYYLYFVVITSFSCFAGSEGDMNKFSLILNETQVNIIALNGTYRASFLLDFGFNNRRAPDLIPQNSPITSYTSYQNGPICNPAEPIRTPNSIQELLAIVRKAIRTGQTIKALGHRHSITDIICTAGIPIDMRGIQKMQMNPTDNNSVTVSAGVTLIDLCNYIKKYNRALKTIPGFGLITIGGAIGTGAHGSSLKYTSTISDQVIGLTIIDGLGNIKKITAEDDLKAFRVHLGLLGIVVDVTLKTEPLYKVRAYNYLVDDNILLNGQIKQIVQEQDQISVYWFPRYGKMVIANWTIIDNVSTPGEAYTNDHVPATSTSFNYFAGLAMEFAQERQKIELMNIMQAYIMKSLFTQVIDVVPIYTEDGVTLQNPAIGYYHEMFAPVCNDQGRLQCPWFHGPYNISFLDNEVGIDLDKLSQATQTIKDILSKYPAEFVMQGFIIRFSKASTTLMSSSYGKDVAHVEFYMVKRFNPHQDASLGLAAYQAIIQTLIKKYDGKSHWAKTGSYFHSKEIFDIELNPAVRKSFVAKMAEYDPNGLFMNSFGERLKGINTKIDIDPRTKEHCALLDDCLCKKNEDCANGQYCGIIKGYPDYPVCKSPLTQLSVAIQTSLPILPTQFSLNFKEVNSKRKSRINRKNGYA